MLKSSTLLNLSRMLAPSSHNPAETVVYATVLNSAAAEDGKFVGNVQFDGAPAGLATPVISSVKMAIGDRVTVSLVGRQALVTGNITAPSVNKQDVVTEVGNATDGLRDDMENIKVNIRVKDDGLHIGKAGSNIEIKQDNDEIIFQTPGFGPDGKPNAIARGHISDTGVSFSRIEATSEGVIGELVTRRTDAGLVLTWEDVQ